MKRLTTVALAVSAAVLATACADMSERQKGTASATRRTA